jgi:drug/metabolite transporter (DMT)-like permease
MRRAPIAAGTIAAPMNRLDPATAALLLLPPLFWAGNAVAGRLLVGTVSPLALSALRWALALAICAPFAWRALRTHWGTLRANWRTVVAIGVLGVGCYNTFQYVALQTSTAVNVTLIAASTPVFVLVSGALFFGERARAAQWLGAGCSIAGVLFVLARGEAGNLLRLSFVAGDLVMLAANATWTAYTWLLRKRRPELPFAPFLTAQMAVGLAAILPFAALETLLGAGRVQATPLAGAMLVYMALFPSIAAYYAWDRGIARVGAVVPVYFANLTPVFAALLSTLLIGEAPQAYHFAGLALIVTGIHLASRQR